MSDSPGGFRREGMKDQATTAMDLFRIQKQLESELTARIKRFEQETGMFVHAVKVYRGITTTNRGIANVEVSAMLR